MISNAHRHHWRLSVVTQIVGVLLAVLAGLLATGAPIVAIIVVIGSIVAVISSRSPNVTTLVFIFLLITNLAVIANKFHNVPFIISASFPLLLIIPLLFLILLRREQIIITPVFVMMIGFLLVHIIGTLVAVNMSEAFSNVITYVIEAIMIYFLLVNVIRTRTVLHNVLIVLFIATIALGIFPIIQFMTNTTDNNYGGLAQIEDEPGFTTSTSAIGTTSQVRYSGAIGEKNRFAQVMFVLMMIALPHAFQSDTRYLRLLASITVAVAGIAGILAFSRGAAVGIPLAFIIAVFFRMFSIRQIITLVIVVMIMLAAVPQYTIRIMSISSLPTLFGIETNSTQSGQPDGALEGRITEMLAAYIIFAEHPIVGVGPGMFQYYVQDVGNQLGIRRLEGARRSHSLYLDILSNTGALGFVLFSMIIITLLRQLHHVHHYWHKQDIFLRNMATGFYLAIVTYLMIGIFLHFAYIRYFWTIIALASVVVQIAKQLEMSDHNKLKDTTVKL